MKRFSLLILFAILMVAEIAANQQMIFIREPLYVYPDSTIVYNIVVDEETGQKVVTIQNPDKSYMIGAMLDPDSAITIEKLKSSTDTVCPLQKKIIIGEVHDSLGAFQEKIFYGIRSSQLRPLTETDFMTGRKWRVPYWGGDNDYDILFGANGTGTCSCIQSKKDYAPQVASGNARGSNQYQTKSKNYGQTGGLTGGYTFVIDALVTYKIEWSIKDNHLLVKRLPCPTVKFKQIRTSMDDSDNPKTPTMTEKQWVKIDLKYNQNVKWAKEDMQYKLEDPYNRDLYPFIDRKILGYTDGVVIYYYDQWYTLEDSGIKGKTPWDLLSKNSLTYLDRSCYGLNFEIPILNYVRDNYQELGDYCFESFVGSYLSKQTIAEWLSLNKFKGSVPSDWDLQSWVDLKKITNITACDSIKYDIVPFKSFFGNVDKSEHLRLKLYYVLTTKKGRKFLTDVCIDFDENFTPLYRNGQKMRYYIPNSFTFLKEIE